MKNYSMVVTVIKEDEGEHGKVKVYAQYYFENPVDAVVFAQDLESDSRIVYKSICASLGEA